MAGYMYNGVYLQLVRTVEFSWKMPRDPSGTDALYTEYTIRVIGFVSTASGKFPDGTTETKQTAVTLSAIKDKLEAPRKQMSYQIGNTVMVQVEPGQIDAKNGPDPLPAVVREVSSGTFYVECGCIVRKVDCGGTQCSRSPVLSLRWSQTESFDQNWNSNLVTTGKLIVRSDLRQCADNFRVDCTPPLLPDYIRTVSRYTLSPDGLELDFHFEDQEVDRLPPFPALTAKGSYTSISPQSSFGFLRFGTVKIELEGQKGTSRAALMIRAIAMAYSKLQQDGLLGPTPVFWGEFSEDLFEPKVMVTLSAKMSNLMSPRGRDYLNTFFPGTGVGGLAAGDKRPPMIPSVGADTHGLKSNRAGLAPPDRKRIAGLLAAAFRDPCACLTAGANISTSKNPPSFQKGSNTVVPSDIEIRSTPFNPGSVPQDTALTTDKAPYDTYHVELTTTYDTGRLHMPGTGTGANAEVSAVVQNHGGLMQLILTWVAGRTGAPPVLPVFQSPDPNIVELFGTVVAKDVVPSPDGVSLVYMFSGWYKYAVIDPRKYKITPPVAPMFGDLVAGGASKGASFWSELVQWLVPKTSNTNPFVGAGVSAVTTGASTPPPPPGFPPPVLVPIGEVPNEGVIGAVAGAVVGGLYYQPRVNP